MKSSKHQLTLQQFSRKSSNDPLFFKGLRPDLSLVRSFSRISFLHDVIPPLIFYNLRNLSWKSFRTSSRVYEFFEKSLFIKGDFVIYPNFIRVYWRFSSEIPNFFFNLLDPRRMPRQIFADFFEKYIKKILEKILKKS